MPSSRSIDLHADMDDEVGPTDRFETDNDDNDDGSDLDDETRRMMIRMCWRIDGQNSEHNAGQASSFSSCKRHVFAAKVTKH